MLIRLGNEFFFFWEGRGEVLLVLGTLWVESGWFVFSLGSENVVVVR